MNFFSGFCAFFLLTAAVGLSSAQKFECPPADKIKPCTCSDVSSGGEVFCDGNVEEITQAAITKVMAELRESNQVEPKNYLRFTTFKLSSTTKLTQIDLTPFLYSRINRLEFYNNSALTGLTGPPLGDSTMGLIDVTALHMGKNALTDQGIGQSLKYFFPSSIQSIGLSKNNVKGSRLLTKSPVKGHPKAISPTADDNNEFLPGLSAFKNLDYINLYSNQIQSVGGGQFRKNSKLTFLGMENNQIEEIAEDAFDFDDPPEEILTRVLNITLHYNAKLKEDNFHQSHGLPDSKRIVALYLHHDQFATLPKATFKAFLDAHPDNFLNVEGNPLVCDERARWLQAGKSDYEKRVIWPHCTNDPGHTVFSSSKVGNSGVRLDGLAALWTFVFLYGASRIL